MNKDLELHSWFDLIRRHGMWVVVFLAFGASLTGITNAFAFDDVRAIVEDSRIHSLSGIGDVFTQTYWLPKYGASLYRPFTSVGFALQWAVGGGSPLPFHIVSILLYGGVCAAVFCLAKQLFDEKTAFLAGAIFAVHPLHVEVVANIVGQAELGAALFVVLAMSRYLVWSRTSGIGPAHVAALCALYASAIMFKEHAIVLPGLIVATEIVVSGDGLPLRRRLVCVLPLLGALMGVAILFVTVRTMVIGAVTGAGVESSVLASQGFGIRFFTMIPVVLEWVRLFIWPASLSADYSSPRIDITTSFTPAMLPAIGIAVALAAIAFRIRRAHASATFAFSWTALALLIPSNLIVVTGFVLAERALFLPSVGVAMLLGIGISAAIRAASPSMRRLVIAAVAAVLIAGVLRSSYRNPVWKNNETLFRQTVEDVPFSWKTHAMLGELLVHQGKGEGILELSLAVKLSQKNDVQVRYFAARTIHMARQHAAALPFYSQAIALDPSNPLIREDAAYCLAQMGRMTEARGVASEGLRLKGGDIRLTRFLRYADSLSDINVTSPGQKQLKAPPLAVTSPSRRQSGRNVSD